MWVCESGTRQATSWPVKLWVTIYHLLGFTCFISINDKNCCDAVRNDAGHHREIVFSAIHWQKKKKNKRITDINWIFDLSWHKFDVEWNRTLYVCSFFMPPPTSSPSPPPNWQQWIARKVANPLRSRVDHHRRYRTGVGKLHLRWHGLAIGSKSTRKKKTSTPLYKWKKK